MERCGARMGKRTIGSRGPDPYRLLALSFAASRTCATQASLQHPTVSVAFCSSSHPKQRSLYGDT
jgi:hypothetical protein